MENDNIGKIKLFYLIVKNKTIMESGRSPFYLIND